jgi:hypothetical protein
MSRKIRHSTTLQGHYQTKGEATKAARTARTLGLGATISKSDWGKKHYAVYMWLKR